METKRAREGDTAQGKRVRLAPVTGRLQRLVVVCRTRQARCWVSSVLQPPPTVPQGGHDGQHGGIVRVSVVVDAHHVDVDRPSRLSGRDHQRSRGKGVGADVSFGEAHGSLRDNEIVQPAREDLGLLDWRTRLKLWGTERRKVDVRNCESELFDGGRQMPDEWWSSWLRISIERVTAKLPSVHPPSSQYEPTKPSFGAEPVGSAISALTPHTIVVSPIRTNAEPSAVAIEPGGQNVGSNVISIQYPPTLMLTSRHALMRRLSGRYPLSRKRVRY